MPQAGQQTKSDGKGAFLPSTAGPHYELDEFSPVCHTETRPPAGAYAARRDLTETYRRLRFLDICHLTYNGARSS
jgi:hypothetical protein